MKMRKVNVLGLLASGLILVGFATSCGDKEEPAGTVKTDATSYLVGDSVKITVSATDDKELSKITVMYGTKEVKTVEVEEKSESQDVTVSAYADAAGDISVTAKIIDSKDNEITTEAVKVTVKDATSAVSQILGAQLADEASYFSIKNMSPVTGEQAHNNSGFNIGFTYAGMTTVKDSTTVEPYILSAFEKTKTTELTPLYKTSKDAEKSYFKLSTLDFAKATANQINKITASTAQYVKIESGKVYEFVTAAGDKGIIKVNSISPVANTAIAGDNYTKSKITVDVKVIKK